MRSCGMLARVWRMNEWVSKADTIGMMSHGAALTLPLDR